MEGAPAVDITDAPLPTAASVNALVYVSPFPLIFFRSSLYVVQATTPL